MPFRYKYMNKQQIPQLGLQSPAPGHCLDLFSPISFQTPEVQPKQTSPSLPCTHHTLALVPTNLSSLNSLLFSSYSSTWESSTQHSVLIWIVLWGLPQSFLSGRAGCFFPCIFALHYSQGSSTASQHRRPPCWISSWAYEFLLWSPKNFYNSSLHPILSVCNASSPICLLS